MNEFQAARDQDYANRYNASEEELARATRDQDYVRQRIEARVNRVTQRSQMRTEFLEAQRERQTQLNAHDEHEEQKRNVWLDALNAEFPDPDASAAAAAPTPPSRCYAEPAGSEDLDWRTPLAWSAQQPRAPRFQKGLSKSEKYFSLP